MLRLSGSKLRWAEEDAFIMAKILGPELASKLRCPYQDVIVRAVSRTRLAMNARARRALRHAARERRLRRRLCQRTDTRPIGYQDFRLERLWPHQRVALSYLNADRPAYLLADRPGVGKTPVAILWALRRLAIDAWEQRPDGTIGLINRPARVLIITPNSAKYQWAREIKRWIDAPARVVEGTIEEQKAILRGSGWIVAHWQALNHAIDAITERGWDVAMLDESQAIRNRDSERAQNAHLLAKLARARLAITGHPFYNRPDELWSQLRFLYPAEYSAFWRYFFIHVKAIPKTFGGYDVLGTKSPKLLRWEIAPFTLRRSKKEVRSSLPELTRTIRTVELGPAARAEYEKLKKEFFVELKGHGDRVRILAIPSVLARVTRLRQYLVDPGLLQSKQPPVKFEAARELLEELDAPTVFFTMFKQAALRFQKFLGTAGTAVVSGGMKKGEIGVIQERFLRGDYRAVIIVTQAGSTALNFGKYGYVAHLDLPWTAADLEQCEGRVDRPEEGTGISVATTSYPFIVEKTYEESQMNLLEDKKSMFDEIFNPKELEALFA